MGASVERYSDSIGVVKGKLPIGNTSLIEVPVTYTVINNYNSSLSANVVTLDTNLVENDKIHTDLTNSTETNIEIKAGEMKEIKQLVQVPANLYYNNNVEITTLLEYSCLGISDKVYTRSS